MTERKTRKLKKEANMQLSILTEWTLPVYPAQGRISTVQDTLQAHVARSVANQKKV